MKLRDLFLKLVVDIYDQKKVTDFMTKLFGHWQSGQATSDPTWQSWRGSIVTKRNGRKSDSARSNSLFYMGQAQQFSLLFLFSYKFLSVTWAKPNISVI